MARKARVEIEGGLYHVITRGNDRQDVFRSDAAYAKEIILQIARIAGLTPNFLVVAGFVWSL